MMLLDTCVLFWLEHDPNALSPAASKTLADPSVVCFASAISALEIGLKVAAGKLKLPLPPGEWLQAVCRRRGIIELPVRFGIAGSAALLPSIHRDPFDRILIATAMEKQLAVMTPDRTIAKYPNLTTLW